MPHFLQIEIDIWKQKEISTREHLLGMIERRIADPESVSLQAVDLMMRNVSNCIYQQKVKQEWMEKLVAEMS